MKLSDFILKQGGRFASVTFTKKNGDLRTINFRAGVKVRNVNADKTKGITPRRRKELGLLGVYLNNADTGYVNPGKYPTKIEGEFPEFYAERIAQWQKVHDCNFRHFYPDKATSVRAAGREYAVLAGSVIGS